MNDIYEQFRIEVIEKLHGKPYNEAIRIQFKKESINNYILSEEQFESLLEAYKKKLPITLERVLKAIEMAEEPSIAITVNGEIVDTYDIMHDEEVEPFADWKLVKDDGFTPCTHLDQTEETIKILMKVLLEPL